MDFSDIDKRRLFKKLQLSYYELSNRGLVRAASWIAEALIGLDLPADDTDELTLEVTPPRIEPASILAKSYFDCREYLRCWNTLNNRKKTKRPNDSVGQFLRLFARYHAGEAKKEDQMGTEIFVDRSKEGENTKFALNPYLEELAAELEELLPAEISQETADPYLLYLQGVIFRARKQNDRAISKLVESCVLCPFNWSCWLELRTCFTKLVDIQSALEEMSKEFEHRPAEDRVMLALFRCFASEELDPAVSSQILIKNLIPLFPKFECLLTQLARIYNGEGHYEAAAQLFEKVLVREPYRIDDLDVYSNLLYVTEQRSKLAFLAQHVAATDKYRTESCCIIANYYSLVGEHEKSVRNYQRAILLNNNYISAWTLMGHEFIELCNPHAAIETYRRAVDLAAYDFRPWFGLGQAYEVLSMYYFAQYYFQRALALRPGDVRLWDALGNCYEQLGRDKDAVNAFEQAFQISGGGDYYTFRLGMLLDRLGDTETALKHITACALSSTAANSSNTSINRPPTVSAALGAIPVPAGTAPSGIGSSGSAASGIDAGINFPGVPFLSSAPGPNAFDAVPNNHNLSIGSHIMDDDTNLGPNVTAPLTTLDYPELDEASEWPIRARLWLAKRAMSQGKWSEALSWARRIDHGTREMLEEARFLEREARVSAQNADPFSSVS